MRALLNSLGLNLWSSIAIVLAAALATESITRGLRKGFVNHQDDAYVYLGLALLKLNNSTGAQRAFASLKNVPDVSSRTLKLWGLYADTLTGHAQVAGQAGQRQPRLGDRY